MFKIVEVTLVVQFLQEIHETLDPLITKHFGECVP